MLTTHDAKVESGGIRGLVIYVSLCMAIAAWGALLGTGWSGWWAIFGAFGFVSAVGLDIRDRRLVRSMRQEREREATQRFVRKLDKVMSGMRAIDEIGTAVNEITRSISVAKVLDGACRGETRLPLNKGITIARLHDPDEMPDESSGESFTGYVRDISPKGVGLIHDRPIERGSVVLAFELESGDHIRLIADVLWCEVQEDGQYFSGGKLRKLVASNDARLETTGMSA